MTKWLFLFKDFHTLSRLVRRTEKCKIVKSMIKISCDSVLIRKLTFSLNEREFIELRFLGSLYQDHIKYLETNHLFF